MSIIDITQASVRSDGPNYNKFDIQKDNMKARILVPNTNIAQAHVHSVYRSEAVMTENNGRVRPEWDNTSYAGSYLCTGDFDKVAAAPSYGDPQACPACAAMNNGPKVVSAPKKTFALNVLQYQTKPNTYEVRGNQVEAKLWKHGDDKKIQPIITALGETGRKINQIDFLIECPPDGMMFKKWQITFSEQVAYTKDDTLKAAVVAAIDADLYSNEELEAACGEKVTAEQLGAKIKEAVASATAGQQASNDNMFVAEANPAAALHAANTSADGPVTETPVIAASDIDDLL